MKRILLVEDDNDLNSLLCLVLKDEGYDIVSYSSAEEALKRYKKGDYSLIISDYKLTGMNGVSFFNKVNLIDPEVVKFLITAHGSHIISAEAHLAGIMEYLEKPFDITLLCRQVNFYIGK